ncbi:MAG: T9SS type A sorting domain-containing protein, partial [Calditrichota bacterium]
PSDSVTAFIGDAPDYLIWIFDDTTQSALNSGDSLLAALQANGRDAALSTDLFGFGSSLAPYKAIFVVLLGGESDILTLQATDLETPALRDYLFNGGSLYAEGGATLQLGSRSGQGFDFRPWFGLQGNETATLFAFGIDFIEGLNSFSGLTYDYDFNFSVTIIEGLNPGSAIELFRTTNTDSHILSVFNNSFGSGRSIATSFPFGAVQETGAGTKVELMSRYLDLLEPVTTVDPLEIDEVPSTFSLEQNYPNPFNPSTTIRYQIGTKSAIKISVYNTAGQRVITLLDKEQNAGKYQITWDGKTTNGNSASSGVYFYRVESEQFNKTRKMILMK